MRREIDLINSTFLTPNELTNELIFLCHTSQPVFMNLYPVNLGRHASQVVIVKYMISLRTIL